MKKLLSVLILFVYIFTLAGCSKEQVIQPEISKPYEKPWGSEEIKVNDVFDEYDYVSLESVYSKGDYKSVIFTTSRNMENQRNVGYANETDNIIVYRDFGDSSGFETVNVDLFEGIVTDVYEYGGELYYAIFYPYAGRGEIIYRESLYLENHIVYTYECKPVPMGESPLEIFVLDNELFAVHSMESDGQYIKKLFYLRGVACTEIAEFAEDQPFDIEIVSVNSDDYLYNVENREQADVQYWKIDTSENQRTFTLYTDEQQDYQYSLPYETGEGYVIQGEDVYIRRTKQAKTFEYKALEFLNKDDNALYELETGDFYTFNTGRSVMIFSHGDYSAPQIKVVRHSYFPEHNHNKIEINPVGLDTTNCLVNVAICDEDIVIMLKDGEKNYRLYDLY